MHDHIPEELGGTYQALGAGLEFGGLETKQCFLLEMALPYILGYMDSLWSPGWPQTVNTLISA